jgi:serine/threonine protein kinase
VYNANKTTFKKYREDLARVYAAEIVSAVFHLHANGIMHRDLKPENIILDADGHVSAGSIHTILYHTSCHDILSSVIGL